MTKEEIAKLMREAHDKLYQLAEILRAKIATTPRGEPKKWIDDLRQKFGNFRTHVCKHLLIEEDGEYLKPVVELRPSLSKQVDLLKNEHRQICFLLDDIHRNLESIGPADNLVLRHVGGRIKNIVNLIERHEDHENHMVMYAVTQDIGTD